MGYLRFASLCVALLMGACQMPPTFPTVNFSSDMAVGPDMATLPDMAQLPDLHGTCGMGDAFVQCHFANAGSMCVDDQCRISGCDLTHEDCNADPSDGCETETGSNPENCGACGNRCPIDREEICVDSHCVKVNLGGLPSLGGG